MWSPSPSAARAAARHGRREGIVGPILPHRDTVPRSLAWGSLKLAGATAATRRTFDRAQNAVRGYGTGAVTGLVLKESRPSVHLMDRGHHDTPVSNVGGQGQSADIPTRRSAGVSPCLRARNPTKAAGSSVVR